MTSEELNEFLQKRNYQLSQEEIWTAIDVFRNSQIDHIRLNGDQWEMWYTEGNYFCISKRD